jgi:hypothetical protein
MLDYVTYRNSIVNAEIASRRNITFMEYSSARFNIYEDKYFQSLAADAGAILQTFSAEELRPSSFDVMKQRLQNASLVVDFTADTVFNTTYANWLLWMGYTNIDGAAQAAYNTYLQSFKYVNSYDAPPFARNQQLWRPDLNSKQGSLGK